MPPLALGPGFLHRRCCCQLHCIRCTAPPTRPLSLSLTHFHSAPPTLSKENTGLVSRHAYTVHIVESHGATWSPDNWLHRAPDFPPEPLFDCSGGAAMEAAPA